MHVWNQITQGDSMQRLNSFAQDLNHLNHGIMTGDRKDGLSVLVKTAESAASPVPSVAEEIGPTGFSFWAPELFGIGEILDCVIALPPGESPFLRAKLEVRSMETSQNGFRICCKISEARAAEAAGLPVWAAHWHGHAEEYRLVGASH